VTLPANPVRIVDLISEEVRRGDASRFLERFLTGWQDQQDATIAALVLTPYLLDPFRMPEVVGTDGRTTLDYALWRQGFVDELEGLAAQLSSDQKRLLIRSAVALWKKKGLPDGWLRWIRLLTGRGAWYAGYFSSRTLLAEDFLGETLLIEPWDPDRSGGATYGAYESDLYVEDPQDSALRQLIVDLVDLTRPSSERVRVRWPDFLETWDRVAALERWTRSGDVTLDTSTKLATVPDGGSIRYDGLGSTYDYYTVQVHATAESSATVLQLLAHYGTTGRAIRVDVDFSAGTVKLYRLQPPAAPALVATSTPSAFPAVGVSYRYDLELGRKWAGAIPALAVALRVDGDAVVDSAISSALLSFAGSFGVGCSGGAAAISRVATWQPPLAYNWLAPSGAVDDEA